MLGLTEEQFLAQYPVGRTFRMELSVRDMDDEATAVVSAQAAESTEEPHGRVITRSLCNESLAIHKQKERHT